MNRSTRGRARQGWALQVIAVSLSWQSYAQAQSGCCFSDGSCVTSPPNLCFRSNGYPVPSCSPDSCLGACCSPDACSLTTEDSCFGRTFYGFGTTCEVCLGACCQCNGSCSLTTTGGCPAAAGTFMGAGTSCDDVACGAPNDVCADRTGLPFDPNATVLFENRCATTDGPPVVDCDNGFQPVGADLWYDYVAPCDGTVRVSLCGASTFDSVLVVYGGEPSCTCPSTGAPQLACGDDTCGVQGGPSQITFSATANRCYLIRVAGWEGATGTGALQVSYDTSCEPPGEGACCLPDGSCHEMLPNPCIVAGGAYQGSGVTCGQVQCGGACCDAGGGCHLSSALACVAPGEFGGLGTTCTGTQCGGACCTPEGCTIASLAGCGSNEFMGLGTTCSSIDCYGACCDPVEGCFDAASIAYCEEGDGEFLGRGTRCASTDCVGACCDPDAGCFEVSTIGSCDGFGDEFHGRGTRCGSMTCFGACCLAGKLCVETTPSGCEGLAGVFQGEGSSCLDECPGRMATGFTYQGQLRDDGLPYSGVADLQFVLWDLPAGGQPIGDPLELSTEVVNGLFQATLDFGESAMDGNARWLEVAVCTQDCAGPDTFTRLEPRQALTPVPYALQTRGIVVDDLERVGIGTKEPRNSLSVVGGADISGNVGIGTASPTSMLHLSRAGADTGIRFQTSRLSLDPALSTTGAPSSANALGWTTPAGAVASDDAYARGGSVSGFLDLTGFGFQLPAQAVIAGLSVTLEWHGDACVCLGGPCRECTAAAATQLIGGAAASEERLFGLNDAYYPAGDDTIITKGGALDAWGLFWTPQQLNSGGFGVRIRADSVRLCSNCGYSSCPYDPWSICWTCWLVTCDDQSGATSSTVSIDAVSVTVYYYPSQVADFNLNWSVGLSQNDSNFRIAPTGDLSSPAIVVTPTGRVGIGVADPVYGIQLTTNDDAASRGLARYWMEYSSRRWKENVRAIPDALEKVLQLQGVMYQWTASQSGETDIGFVAEDVAAVVPELVQMEPDGRNALGMKYDRVSALTVEAIKQLHADLQTRQIEIMELKTRLTRVEALLEGRTPAATTPASPAP